MSERPEDNLILRIREMAGDLGGLLNELPNVADADNYDFQVQVGLAHAVTSILDHDVEKVMKWFGYCLIDHGVEVDDRIGALLDALEREVFANLNLQDEDEAP